MAEFDVVIRGGMVIDGTRMPRYRADVGIKDGKVAKIGNLKAHQAKKGNYNPVDSLLPVRYLGMDRPEFKGLG